MSVFTVGVLLWVVGVPLGFFVLLALYPGHLRKRIHRNTSRTSAPSYRLAGLGEKRS